MNRGLCRGLSHHQTNVEYLKLSKVVGKGEIRKLDFTPVQYNHSLI